MVQKRTIISGSGACSAWSAANAFRPGCDSGRKAFFLAFFWSNFVGGFWWAVYYGGGIFQWSLFSWTHWGGGGLISLRLLSAKIFTIFFGLWGFGKVFPMEHITSIMIHPVSKICLCFHWMQDEGENLSVFSAVNISLFHGEVNFW